MSATRRSASAGGGDADPESVLTLIDENGNPRAPGGAATGDAGAVTPGGAGEPAKGSALFWVAFATDCVLVVSAVVMIAFSGEAGGSGAAGAMKLVARLGVSLLVLSLVGIGVTVGAATQSCGLLPHAMALGQVLAFVVLIILEIIAMILFFGFFSSVQNSSSQELDASYPTFANFANCTWNTCCLEVKVRERSFGRLDCDASQVNPDGLAAVCQVMPRQQVNASACIEGHGLDKFRSDVGTWIFGAMMSWSWIVVVVMVLEVVAIVIYCCRWQKVRTQYALFKSKQAKKAKTIQ